MARLNLTLDDDTEKALLRHAHNEGITRASIARELIQEGLRQREAQARRNQLAKDYAAGRADAVEILGEMEAAQLEVLGAEDQ